MVSLASLATIPFPVALWGGELNFWGPYCACCPPCHADPSVHPHWTETLRLLHEGEARRAAEGPAAAPAEPRRGWAAKLCGRR
jgi:hypothetical protein